MAGRGTDILLGGSPSYLALDLLREQGAAVEGITAEQLSGVAADLDLAGLADAELAQRMKEASAGRDEDGGVPEFVILDDKLQCHLVLGGSLLAIEDGPKGLVAQIPEDGQIDLAEFLDKLEAAIGDISPEARDRFGSLFGRLNEERALLPVQAALALERARRVCADEHDRVIAAGGLCVIGTERHESRRIDNQLRGRSGRQGDPGETQFYLSLEDDLMRLFAGDRMGKIADLMERWEMPPDEPIQAKIVTRSVESAQRKVEEVNFAMRKNVLDYDDVMNKQREVIYDERNKILDGKDLVGHVSEVAYDTVQRKVFDYCPENVPADEWDARGLAAWLSNLTGRSDAPAIEDGETTGDLVDKYHGYVKRCYNEKAERLGETIMHDLSSRVMLRVIDTRWMSYLEEMDYLKTGIGLRGFGQRDPLVEYKTEAYAAFAELVSTMYEDYLRTILRIEVVLAPAEEESSALRGARYSGPAEVDGDQGRRAAPAATIKGGAANAGPRVAQAAPDKPRTYRKADDSDPYVGVGRNQPCPCGSGKKFKNCHGRNR
ncbi:hypothetical protein EII22_03025 [Coriobacteriales bacterium OH1046]|nr:hypothetical protein EII22_03025 [Coriobacteriales bacterium OH1046]